MSISGIQGQLLEITVVGCNKLKDTEWISRQDPYVCLEYGSTKYRTRTCTDGGKNPTFQEKFVFTLIEGLRELSVVVWNSNTISLDDFIGSGKIQLQKVLSQGFDDSSWPLQDKRGRHAGEVRLIVHYSNANKPGVGHSPSAPQYSNSPGAPHIPHYSNSPGAPHIPPYSNPPGAPHVPPYSTTPSSYPPTSFPPPAQYPSYPPTSAGYPPSYHQPAAYPPSYPPGPSYPAQAAYPPPTGPHLYPPSSYPPAYPPTTYPPPTYPPPY